MILTLCYEIALKAFNFFYFSGRYAVPHSCGTIIVCLTGLQYEINKVSKVEKNKLKSVLHPATLWIRKKCTLHIVEIVLRNELL